jgi:hypothetical protein
MVGGLSTSGTSSYCGYFALSAASAARKEASSCCAWGWTTRPLASMRIHQSRFQSSVYSSSRRLTSVLSRMFRTRASSLPALGFPSMGDHRLSPTRTNTMGTWWGRPPAPVVARRATGQWSSRPRMTSGDNSTIFSPPIDEPQNLAAQPLPFFQPSMCRDVVIAPQRTARFFEACFRPMRSSLSGMSSFPVRPPSPGLVRSTVVVSRRWRSLCGWGNGVRRFGVGGPLPRGAERVSPATGLLRDYSLLHITSDRPDAATSIARSSSRGFRSEQSPGTFPGSLRVGYHLRRCGPVLPQVREALTWRS